MPYFEIETEEPDYYVVSAAEYFYIEAINKLKDKWNMLSQEEEDFIMKIANRF